MTGTIVTGKSHEPPIPQGYRGRFAPSPSGPLHLGSIVAAVASYLDAKSNDGSWILRIEDIDPARQPDDAIGQILGVLEALGLQPDETVSYQSARNAAHNACIDALLAADKAYFCQCSRKDIQANTPAGSKRYPGTCKHKNHSDGAVRVRVPDNWVNVDDRAQGFLRQNVQDEVGDFVIRRKDGLIAYQLAVVLDDAFQSITDVVRGTDLWDNAPRQRCLQRLLGLDFVSYLHVPVVTDSAGNKLSKQTGAIAVTLQNPARVLCQVLALLRHKPPANLHQRGADGVLNWGVAHWNPDLFKGIAAVQQKPVAPQQNPLR